MVFIPKPGRLDYNLPGAFRPICLMSFPLKAVEKLIDRHIKERALKLHPLHQGQFAYLPGKSVDAVLYSLVHRLEEAWARQNIAAGLFLDIEGAFNYTSVEAIERAVERHGIDPTTRSGGESRGCPQGGIISPLLWNLVVDELIVKLNQRGFYTQAYADDLATVVIARDANTVSGLLRTALEKIKRWCIEAESNPTGSVKHLEVILDAKLSWGKQLDFACGRACALLWATKRICGKTWGIGPAMMRWLYTALVRPLFMHGALLWWNRTSLKSVRASLDYLQGLASRLITGAIRTTPVVALGVALGLPPLHIMMEAAAMASAHRLKTGGQWKEAARENNKSHTTI
ncbi:lian-aa1 retrotransposon protein [Lasius niger]|uniref:Lian-aa1 retrotransposon protein n=1 Tax=Lasius niger TaxID=67767 RepID=A0A0J7NBA7_LASNI|nr:lian-aa1 retrotransposon protein [Lasius niger]